MSDSPGTTRPNWPMQSSPWGLQIASQQPTPRHRLTRVERSDHQFPTVTVDSLFAIVLSMGYINGLYQWVDPVVWDELKTSQVGTQLHNPATTIFRRALFPYNAIILLWNIFSWNAQVFVKRADYTKIAIWWQFCHPIGEDWQLQPVVIRFR